MASMHKAFTGVDRASMRTTAFRYPCLECLTLNAQSSVGNGSSPGIAVVAISTTATVSYKHFSDSHITNSEIYLRYM